ncbi:MAG: FAD-binding oxidoreductase [Planctomycetes bacterium]|nr:FAD-binding oxidoreductase [Planctomycetota bacterium]
MSSSLTRFAPELDARVVGRLRPHPRSAELPLVAPRTRDELVECLRAAHRDGLALVPCGRGSKLAWTQPPERADFVLSVRELSGFTAHEPDDGTISVLAGTTLADLRAKARVGGHWCTPDLPQPTRATIGGALALGRSGSDRTRYAPLRNHVLGMSVVLADGTVAKSGGKLVKNVTGYDLHRLYTGSHGTLAVIVEAALRLFPAPESEAWFEREFASFTDALAAARAVADLPVRWLALSLVRARGRWRACGRLAGKHAVVEHEVGLVRATLGEPTARDGAAAERADALRDAAPSTQTSFARIACRPSRVAEVVRMLDLEHTVADATIEPTIASLEFALAGDARALAAHRELLAKRGASLHLVAPDSDAVPFDAPGPELALMHRLKQRLDPQGVFARGRFVGGL